MAPTDAMFNDPHDPRTADYARSRFGRSSTGKHFRTLRLIREPQTSWQAGRTARSTPT
jgi:hypothetical protein